MRETWYVTEDGNAVDPNECTSDEKGALTHKSGAKVALKFADVPLSRSVDVDVERAKGEDAKKASEAAEAAKKAAAKDQKPDANKAGYKTRDSKAS